MKTVLNEVEEIKMDKCVLCDDETPYTENTHIKYRNYYVEGAGQLCSECFHKVYGSSNKNELLLG